MAALKAAHVSEVPHLDEVAESPSVATRLPPTPRRFQVIGHRGSGMNALPSPASDPRLAAVKENTILSFNQAGRFPIGFVEFDVQVTRDDHPVIFHDVSVLSTEDGGLTEKRVTDLSLEEFLSYGPQKESGKPGKPLLRRGRDGVASPWTVETDDSLCTLQEAFLTVDSHVGFNIELKFDDDLDYQEEELTRALQTIMGCVVSHAGGRPIIFSSFHPDAVRLMGQLQSIHPVFFLTDGGTETYSDVRRNSMEAAIKLCTENGLQGIVSEVRGVFRDPSAVARIKEANLALLTYWELNNVAEVVYMQHLMGIDGVIVDLVPEITEAVSDVIGLVEEQDKFSVGIGEEEEGVTKTAAGRPTFSQRDMSFLFKLIPKLMQ